MAKIKKYPPVPLTSVLNIKRTKCEKEGGTAKISVSTRKLRNRKDQQSKSESENDSLSPSKRAFAKSKRLKIQKVFDSESASQGISVFGIPRLKRICGKVKRKKNQDAFECLKHANTERFNSAGGFKSFKPVHTNSADGKSPSDPKIRKCLVRLKRYKNSRDDTVETAVSRSRTAAIGERPENSSKKNSENDIQGGAKNCKRMLNNGASSKERTQHIEIALRTSTPLKMLPSPREPFKELNLTIGADNWSHTAILPIITKEKREGFRKLSLSKSKQKRSENNKRADLGRNIEVNAGGAPTTVEFEQNIETNLQSPEIVSKLNEKVGGEKDLDKSLEATNKSRSFSQNLADKHDLIEQIILSNNDDDDDCYGNTENYLGAVDQTATSAPVATKTHKFFHRDKESAEENINSVNIIQPVNPRKRASKKSKKKCDNNKISSIEKIYDFLAQSQTSESDDAAADVIKRLIQEGKVRVATHKKGTGKPVIKRRNILNRHAAQQQRKEKTATKRVKKKKKEELGKKIEAKGQVESFNNDDLPLHAVQNAEENPIDLYEKSISPTESEFVGMMEIPEKTYAISKSVHDTSMLGSTFSKLARSVIVSEAEKMQTPRKRVTDQRKLLEMVRKFVSTPANKTAQTLDKTTNMSPIYPPQIDLNGATPGNLSPWRINDDCHLPSVFYFSRNTENLPSFSSDYIPSSPTKQKAQSATEAHLLPPSISTPMAAVENTSIRPSINPAAPTLAQSSPLSSFSSNDSNAENIPPTLPQKQNVDAQDDATSANGEAINKRQQLNPLQTHPNRDPLKAINILEVITLPQWNSEKSNAPLSASEARESSYPSISNQSQNKNEDQELFGFDEYIANDEVEDQQQPELKEIEENNLAVEQKLQRLKRLRPTDKKINRISKTKPLMDIFDEDRNKNQLKINEMLSSTKVACVNHPGKQKRNDGRDMEGHAETASPKLFYEPEEDKVLFSRKELRRTYERPYKRKRKLRHNFIMFNDSDDSSEEEEYRDIEAESKKKRHKKGIDQNEEEFNNFAKEFNEMCREVDQYNIVVE